MMANESLKFNLLGMMRKAMLKTLAKSIQELATSGVENQHHGRTVSDMEFHRRLRKGDQYVTSSN